MAGARGRPDPWGCRLPQTVGVDQSRSIAIRSAAETHVGLVRRVNEDAYLTLPTLALVADGMGGHACGDVASALVVSEFHQLVQRAALAVSDVAEAIGRANDRILSEAVANPARAGMGTTACGIVLAAEGDPPHWVVFNVGDSRVYRVYPDALVQLTVDHSEVADLVAAGSITAQAARSHPLRNVVTRALGSNPPPVPDTWLLPVLDDDLFLICSDGLTLEVEDGEIARIVRSAPSLAQAARSLVARAVEAGGRDNVTVVLVAAPAGTAPVDRDDTRSTPVTRNRTHAD